MNDEAIKKWVIESEKRGVGVSQIKQELKNRGYTPDLADEILKPKKKLKNLIMASSLVLLVILLSVAGYILFEKFYKTTTEDQFKKAELYYSNGEYDHAMRIYKEIVEKYPDSSYISNIRLGEIYSKNKDYNTALYYFKKARTIMRSSARLIKKLKMTNINRKIGSAYFAMGNYQAAEFYFNEELSHNPKDYDTTVFLGRTYFKLKDYEKSKLLFEKALKIKPDDKLNYLRVGIAYTMTKDYSKSKEYLNEAVKYYPEDYSINLALGNTYYGLGEYENSYNCFTKAVSIKPDSEDAKDGLKKTSEKLAM